MKKLLKNHRLLIYLILTIAFLVLTATVFNSAFANIGRSGAELWHSFLGYIRFILNHQLPEYSPINPPAGGINILPDTSSEFRYNLIQFFRLLFTWDNFRVYVGGLEGLLLTLVTILPFLILFIIVLRKYIKSIFTRQNNHYNKNSIPLKAFNCISKRIYVPIRDYVENLFSYIKGSHFPKIWLLIWLFNFNVFAVTLSLIAILLYFFISFNFISLYHFFYNTVVMLAPAFRIIPIWIWLILVLYLIDRRRKRKALDRLRHMELCNKGFILERSICTMLVGTMGSGKTTLATDMALSTEAIFRHKAYEMMLEIDLKFPHFPYIMLENELKKEIEADRIFNLASCRAWVDKIESAFSKEPNYDLFSYDYCRFGVVHNDKKKLTSIFDALRDYTQLYFIYIVNSSLILSNYAIRTDFRKIDKGNLPYWNLDFFAKDSRYIHAHSRHSHILDFDMLRLGKKLIEDNKQANMLEFFVCAISEVGKERKNKFGEQDIKDTIKQLRETIKSLEKARLDATTPKAELQALTERATVLTDKFNTALKLIRHKSTVANFPFARVILDEQRSQSLGSDARDLCEIIHIKEKSETKITMPFFFIGELIHALIFPKFKGAYQSYRINRGDNTLILHLLKKLGAGIHNYYTGIYNRFGYHIRYLAVEDGATGQVIKECPYYVSTKKIYSNRFSTDAYKDIFAEQLKSVNIGIDDIAEYNSHKATQAELEQQNSYFINELVKNGGSTP